MAENILVIGHSNIGDVCYDLAVINPLRCRFPYARISFLTSSRCRDIVLHYKGVDEVITYDRHGKDKGKFGRLKFIARLWKTRFDLAVVLRSSFMFHLLRVARVWRITRRDHLIAQHPVDRYRRFVGKCGLNPDDVRFNFEPRADEVAYCDDFFQKRGIDPKQKIVGILPVAAWNLKSWPIEKWNALAEALKNECQMRVINLGKIPNDDLGRKIQRVISEDIIPADKTTLAQAKALLQRCDFFVGPDSSLIHLASCMGIETIGLYGATSSEHFYPYFHQKNIVLPRKKLACMPCYPGAGPSCCTETVKHDYGPCMQGIEVDDILTIIRERQKGSATKEGLWPKR